MVCNETLFKATGTTSKVESVRTVLSKLEYWESSVVETSAL